MTKKKAAPKKKLTQAIDPLVPGISLLVKLGSAIVHADEFLSPTGHPFDKQEFERLLIDPEVSQWLATMAKLAMVPRKR